MSSDLAPDHAPGPSTQLEEGLEGGAGGGADNLSPRQYSMLMNSMRDPLAMYTSSLAAAPEQDMVGPSPPPPYHQFDPLGGYTGHPYNISPTYGHLGGGAEGRGHSEVEGDETHPMYAMMTSTYQPRPPTAPRNPQNRH